MPRPVINKSTMAHALVTGEQREFSAFGPRAAYGGAAVAPVGRGGTVRAAGTRQRRKTDDGDRELDEAGAGTQMDGACGRRRSWQCRGAHLVQPSLLRRAASAVRGRRAAFIGAHDVHGAAALPLPSTVVPGPAVTRQLQGLTPQPRLVWVELRQDRSHGMVRTEVRCAKCGSRLGSFSRARAVRRGRTHIALAEKRCAAQPWRRPLPGGGPGSSLLD
ncbi:hypothetical protein GCM10012280_49980 [Wenjunlia tyrosinilytica]|uniref:Uncharacterized protein n=1 Tax=Wenjunlia tyrosinilytica TaxID=1544741 RepID=A0A918E0I0_9ACTN|nr:hypothetical protein GCM10012280_49980 [Wenjunlia tyrosinilytica]